MTRRTAPQPRRRMRAARESAVREIQAATEGTAEWAAQRRQAAGGPGAAPQSSWLWFWRSQPQPSGRPAAAPPPPQRFQPQQQQQHAQQRPRELPPLRNPLFLSRGVLALTAVFCAWNGAAACRACPPLAVAPRALPDSCFLSRGDADPLCTSFLFPGPASARAGGRPAQAARRAHVDRPVVPPGRGRGSRLPHRRVWSCSITVVRTRCFLRRVS